MSQYRIAPHQHATEYQQATCFVDGHKINLSADTYAFVLWPSHAEQAGSNRQTEPLETILRYFLLNNIGHDAKDDFSLVQQWTEELCARFFADRVFGIPTSHLDCAAWPCSPLPICSIFGFSELIPPALSQRTKSLSHLNFNSKSHLALAVEYNQPEVGQLLMNLLPHPYPTQDLLQFCSTYCHALPFETFRHIQTIEDDGIVEATLKYAPELLGYAVAFSDGTSEDLIAAASDFHSDPAKFFRLWLRYDYRVVLSPSFLDYVLDARLGHLVLPLLEECGKRLIITDRMAKLVKYTEQSPFKGKPLMMLPASSGLESILSVDPKNPTTRKHHAQMIAFLNDRKLDTLTFPAPLEASEHETICEIAQYLGLSHSSHGVGNQRQVRVHRRRVKRVSTLLPVYYDSKLIERRAVVAIDTNVNQSEGRTAQILTSSRVSDPGLSSRQAQSSLLSRSSAPGIDDIRPANRSFALEALPGNAAASQTWAGLTGMRALLPNGLSRVTEAVSSSKAPQKKKAANPSRLPGFHPAWFGEDPLRSDLEVQHSIQALYTSPPRHHNGGASTSSAYIQALHTSPQIYDYHAAQSAPATLALHAAEVRMVAYPDDGQEIPDYISFGPSTRKPMPVDYTDPNKWLTEGLRWQAAASFDARAEEPPPPVVVQGQLPHTLVGIPE